LRVLSPLGAPFFASMDVSSLFLISLGEFPQIQVTRCAPAGSRSGGRPLPAASARCFVESVGAPVDFHREPVTAPPGCSSTPPFLFLFRRAAPRFVDFSRSLATFFHSTKMVASSCRSLPSEKTALVGFCFASKRSILGSPNSAVVRLSRKTFSRTTRRLGKFFFTIFPL